MRSIFFGFLALLGVVAMAPALALSQDQPAEPEGAPQLRLEAGMHTAVVRHIGVSADGTRIVSGSYDKTLRLWSVPDNKLLNVFRLPIGEGFEGSVFAVALTPDGKTIAAGGWMKQHFVYLIDATNGSVIRTFGPNNEVANNIVFSPDGSKVVVIFGRQSGMRMFDVATGNMLAEDTNYADDAYGLAFSENGMFATTSYDGLVRLYAQDGGLLSQVNAPSGKKVYSVAFRPGTDELAIGYNDSNRVDLFSTSTYEWLPQPDLSDVEGGDLGTVGWSRDGQTLYAGGAFRDKDGWYRLVAWSDGGRGPKRLLYKAADSIFDLEPYLDKGIALASALPQLAVIKDDQPIMEQFTPIAGMGRSDKGNITASEDGSIVRFSLDFTAAKQVQFDSKTLELKDVGGTPDNLIGADMTSLKVENYYGRQGTTLEGKELPVDSHETSFSVAIAPDKKSIALGTAWYVRKYNDKGEFQWRTAVSGVAWGVTYAQDGKVIIAALGDGTIRWFRAEDGKEVLALFVHNTDKRWVMWSPKGFYAASPGGEDLIGWHINRDDRSAPDFFPASRLRNTYYRPDVVQQIMSVLDEDQAIAKANAAAGRHDEEPAEGVRAVLPAVIEIAMDGNEIKTATSPVQISYRVRSPSGEPIEGIDILIDGRPLETRAAEAVPDENEVNTVDVAIPQRDVEIGLIARTKTGASEVKIVKVKWDGAFAELLKPKLYAVVVGVSGYKDSELKLKYAAKDAHDFAEALKRQEGGIYGKVEVRLLTDDNATRDAIVESLEWLESQVRARDVGMVFMAGHGVTDNKQRFYYLPYDANMDKLRSSAVSRDDMLSTMGALAGKAMMFIDACHSATSLNGEQTRGVGADITQVVNELSSAENGVVMFASSTGRQLSIESDRWQNGAFTKALIEGLSGKADFVPDGKLTIAELDLWLADRVKELTENRQAPVVRKPDTIPDFPIALVR